MLRAWHCRCVCRLRNINISFVADLANPKIWDPGDRIRISSPYYVDIGSMYEITVTSDYASKSTVDYNSSEEVIIYVVQPDPVDPIENISYMRKGISVYNPNNYQVTI